MRHEGFGEIGAHLDDADPRLGLRVRDVKARARWVMEPDVMQPQVAGNWNPQGYGAKPLHRVAIRIA